MIGLRYPWTTDTYLTGAPIIVPLYGGGNSGFPRRDYPDAMPVLITVEAVAPGKDGRLTSYQQLEKRAGGKSMRLVPIDKSKPATGHNAAIEVIIKLAPAEDFCVDIWALPDLGQLAQWFDAPESVAFCCAASKHDETPDPAEEKQKLLDAMPGKIPNKPDHLPLHTIRRNDAVVSFGGGGARGRSATRGAESQADSRIVGGAHLACGSCRRAAAGRGETAGVDRKHAPEIRFLRVDETKRSEIVGPPSARLAHLAAHG